MDHVGSSGVSKQFRKFLSKNSWRLEFACIQIVFKEAVQRARNMSRHWVERFILPMETIRRARIDDGSTRRCKIVQNRIDQDQSLIRTRRWFVYQRYRGRYRRADLSVPGLQSAIQHLHLVMPNRPQHPP